MKLDIKNLSKNAKITAVVVLLAVILASVAIILIAFSTPKTLNYMEMDLSKYISIKKSDYQSYTVEINVPDLTETDYNDKLISVLCANKTKPDTTPSNKKGITISAGDIVNLYYAGYILKDDGTKNYFDGGMNIGNDIASLEIGAGQFISGFEYNLIGKNQNDYATLDEIKTGNIEDADIISIKYTVFDTSENKTKSGETAVINLKDIDLDETWGEGFTAYFKDVDRPIGTKFAKKDYKADTDKEVDKPLFVVAPDSEDNTQDCYYDITIEKAYRLNTEKSSSILEVEAHFPYDYESSEELRGKTAIFEAYIMTVQDYDVPNLTEDGKITEKFITENLKLTEEDLKSYGGETLVAMYENKLKSELEKTHEDNKNAAVETAFWTYIMKKASFKKLPEDDVRTYYDDSVNEIEAIYENYNYSSQYTFDQFAQLYLGTESGKDWKTDLMEKAEESVKQKLVFYYIVKEMNFIPTEAEATELREELYAEMLEAYLNDAGADKNADDYQEKVEEAEKYLDETYSDYYWQTNVQYVFGMEKIRSLAKVNVNTEPQDK